MTPQDTTYNGWTNYETWATGLWLDNDQYTHEDMRQRAERISEEYNEGLYDDKYDAIYEMNEYIKQWLEQHQPNVERADLFTDLLNSSISRINTVEIAKNYLYEFKEELGQ